MTVKRLPSWRLAATAIAALMLTACGSTVHVGAGGSLANGVGTDGLSVGTSDTSTPTGTDPSASAAPDATQPGSVPEESAAPTTSGEDTSYSGATGAPSVASSKPIQIGVILTNTSSVAASGFSSGESFSEKDIDQALIAAMNAKGGVSGHKLEAVYAMTDPNSSSWDTDFAAACAAFTQDHHVAAVLGYQFAYNQSFETCLTKKGVPQLENGFNVPDRQELAHHPLHRSLAVPTIDVRSVSKLRGAIADGYLTKKSKLAVALDGCPGTERSWNQVSLPFLKSQGINPVEVIDGGNCPNGSGSTASAANGVPSAIIKARQLGVDVLTFLSVSEGPAIAIVAIAAEAQGWHPLYITGSLGNLSALQGQIPPAQETNIKGYGWMPGQDVVPALQPPKTKSQNRCISLLKSQKVTLTQFGDVNNAYRICDALFAYEAALKKSGGDTSGPAVVRAVDSFGTSFDNPDVLQGATIFGPGHENNAPRVMRAVVWDGGNKRFIYTGPLRPLA